MDNLIPDQLQPADKTLVISEELNGLLKQLPEWTIVEANNIKQLQRKFSFRNFADALAFTNRIAELSEQVNHHPTLMTEWGRVTVTWWTHSIHGLHLNDFVMAKKTEQIYASLHVKKLI